MSDETRPTSDDSQQDSAQVSEEQAREYAQQLRSAPAEQVVTEVLSGLLNAAQVKLGRNDARLMIDLSALVHDQARQYVSANLTKQVDQALGQLRMGQVQAEKTVANQEQDEQNDLGEAPAPPANQAGQQPASSTQPRSQARPASRLWVPGRNM